MRDKNKLLVALNNIRLGQYRVWTNYACFDRDRSPIETIKDGNVEVREDGVKGARVEGEEIVRIEHGEIFLFF